MNISTTTQSNLHESEPSPKTHTPNRHEPRRKTFQFVDAREFYKLSRDYTKYCLNARLTAMT